MSFVEQLIDWSYYSLLVNDEARDYFSGRGVSEEQWERHRLGFIPEQFIVNPDDDKDHCENCFNKDKTFEWCDSCRYINWSSKFSKTSDGINRDIGVRIIGSVVLPLTTYSGKIIGFQIRNLHEKVYDTFLIKERPEPFFFGIGPNVDLIWRTKEISLVEGPFDQLIFERLVKPNVVALTTNSVSRLQLRFLTRFVNRINLCLELDSAGRKGV